jgi:hypothetical protein
MLSQISCSGTIKIAMLDAINIPKDRAAKELL